jgi:hypothetical protein
MFTFTAFFETEYEVKRRVSALWQGVHYRNGLQVFMKRHQAAVKFEVHRATFDKDGFLLPGEKIEIFGTVPAANRVTDGISVNYTANDPRD